MALFRKRRRVDVGRYVAPDPRPELPVDELVDEGALIAGAAVRLAVKNGIVLRALRDRADYDEQVATDSVRQELLDLVAEKIDDAERIADAREGARDRHGKAVHQSDYREGDLHTLRRREDVSRGLADRLRELSDDDEYLRSTFARANDAALDELSAWIGATIPGTGAPRDPIAYERNKTERLRALISVDLATLEAQNIPEY